MNLLETVEAKQAELNLAKQALSKFGRELYAVRNPSDEGSLDSYAFSCWSRGVVSEATEWEDDEEAFFDIGTPILTLSYYHKRWEDEKSIVIPIEYLDSPETAIERERLAIEDRRRIREERARRRKEIQAEKAIVARREQYERLKAEFGESST
jgi:hypothetical protein